MRGREYFSLSHLVTTAQVSTPSRISIRPTANSMVSPTRGGIARLKRMIAAPTTKMVSVWPTPHKAPISAALERERSRVTMVEDGDDVIRFRGMTHTQKEPDDENGQSADHRLPVKARLLTE